MNVTPDAGSAAVLWGPDGPVHLVVLVQGQVAIAVGDIRRDATVGWRKAEHAGGLGVLPALQDETQATDRAAVRHEQHSLAGLLTVERGEERIYPRDYVGEALATRRTGEEPAEGLPVLLDPREVRLG